ncbi:MAG: DUF1559 domain-containing protein [Planctomycetota bacterium]
MEREIVNRKLRRTRKKPAERGLFRHSQFSILNFQFSISTPYCRPPRGFTLVELLVVITIIGILLAILLPAVNMIREDSRQTTCMNNQMQIGRAIIMYEDAKRRLPGVLNKGSRGTPPVDFSYSWVAALFPYLERGDMWDTIRSKDSALVANVPKMRLNIVICPNDPFLIDPTSPNVQALLSYRINGSVFVSYVDETGKLVVPPPTPPLLSKRTDLATTIMIGERTGDGMTPLPRAGKWTDVPPLIPLATALDSLTFGTLSSAHPGKVVKTFLDGHGEKVSVDQ